MDTGGFLTRKFEQKNMILVFWVWYRDAVSHYRNIAGGGELDSLLLARRAPLFSLQTSDKPTLKAASNIPFFSSAPHVTAAVYGFRFSYGAPSAANGESVPLLLLLLFLVLVSYPQRGPNICLLYTSPSPRD